MNELYYHGIDPNDYNFLDDESIASARDKLRGEICTLENITIFDQDLRNSHS